MSEDGRQDTWAEWKSAVIALSDDALHRYLEDVEGYSPDQVAAFVARDSAVTPEDWATPNAAHDAMTRFFAFKKDVLDRGGPGPALASQEAREAALPPSAGDVRGRTRPQSEREAMMPDMSDQTSESAPRPKSSNAPSSEYDDEVSGEGDDVVVESNSSNYGAGSIDPAAPDTAKPNPST